MANQDSEGGQDSKGVCLMCHSGSSLIRNTWDSLDLSLIQGFPKEVWKTCPE